MGEAIKDFPWRRGMSSNGAVLTDADIVAVKQGDTYGMTPDRNDGATRGAFLDAVREAWGRPDICTRSNRAGTSWTINAIGTPDALLDIEESTEWDAIEAAWSVRPGVKRG